MKVLLKVFLLKLASMKFINIVVHSTQNMNFRVHLQYELTLLGLDEFINKKLRLNENEKLQMEIQVYLDNQLDIEELIEDSELKNMKEKELENLTEEFLVEKDKFNDALNKITELQKQNEILMKELTLSKQLEIKKINDEREINENSLIPNPTLPLSLLLNKISNPLNGAPSQIPLPPPLPPSIPVLQGMLNLLNAPIPSMNIKHSIETKNDLPNFNWTPLKPQQIEGTLFCELNDDENLLKIIDFVQFEELFKIGTTKKMNINININSTLLEKEQERNIGISLSRKRILFHLYFLIC